jgi:hypothetical protein
MKHHINVPNLCMSDCHIITPLFEVDELARFATIAPPKMNFGGN